MTTDRPGPPHCPKCRGEMVQRLDEYECTGCGYFTSASRLANGPDTGPTRIQQKISAAQQLLPGASGRSKPVLYARDRVRPGFWARWLKTIFLMMAFAETVGMSLYVRHLHPELDIDGLFIRQVVFAALLVTGLAALALFINWAGFKKFAAICGGLLIVWTAINGYLVWNDAMQELLVHLVLDVLMLGWFIFILVSDIISYR